MGSSTNRGNISSFMTFLAITVLVLLLCHLSYLMVSGKSQYGRYNDPEVASLVVRGTIYDRNSRILAIQVPENDLFINKDNHNIEEISQILSLYLELTPSAIKNLVSNSSSNEVLITSSLSDQDVYLINQALSKANLNHQVTFKKKYSRTYPALFHASQLISETEKVYDAVLSPVPEYNKSTTYGNNVYLTIDLDIQYLLDLALQQVYEIQSPDYSIAFILDIETAQMLASTTYPFYDLNEDNFIMPFQKVNRTFVSNISREDFSISNISVVSKITDYFNQAELNTTLDTSYTKDLDEITNLVNKENNCSILSLIPSENPKYVVFIASLNPKYYEESSILEYAVNAIEEGLISQSKI